MKQILPLLLLASCTAHQIDRIDELYSTPNRALHLRQRHLVEEALVHPDASYAFSLHAMPPMDTSRGTLPLYALKADGIPTGERFILASRNDLNGAISPHFEFEVLEDNTLRLFTANGDETMAEAPLILKDLLKGQNVSLAIVSKERNRAHCVTFTPSPYEVEVDDIRFALRVAHRKGTHFRLQASGLFPGEPIVVIEQSGPEVRQHRIAADAGGRIDLPIEPIVYGKLGGPASVTIARGEFESRIDYFWGGRLEIESRGESIFHPLVFVANRDPEKIDSLALLTKFNAHLYL